MQTESSRPDRVAVVGGAGHVGLPLAILVCDRGFDVTVVDISTATLDRIRGGEMPFFERGADELLQKVLKSGRFQLTESNSALSDQDIVIVTIGTPVDEYLDPDVRTFDRVMNGVLDVMHDGQMLVIRSTVFPGVTDRLIRQVADRGLKLDIVYCPERIAQGYAVHELIKLPQIVSGSSPQAVQRAAGFFKALGAEVIELQPVEAELAKLFTNSYRYMNFAIANQFYMLAERHGADFERIRHAVTYNYPRMQGFSGAGFAAGPCLLKDTMQLASFNHNLLTLGQHAMMVNEALPHFVVEQLKRKHELYPLTVGVLGMAFKGNCDDPRSSLSYKLRKILKLECRRVLCTDVYIQDPEFVPLETCIAESDLLILGACHEEYRSISTTKPIVDVFGFLPRPQSTESHS
ncbi:nucleotide sugar dehydrogenase [Planctomicrobium sp. SH664]|uniref:nucleotide sugar dehydrogenase n=1 Tax=Planctomicrobium sp. SH664 TaxID=3448125 RepID=UPI003F5C99D2